MGKKKKVEISKDPLSPITVGEINKHRFGWLLLVFVFVFFIAMIYYLPDLYAEFDAKGNLSFDYIINMVKDTFSGAKTPTTNTNQNTANTSQYDDINSITNGTIGNLIYANLIATNSTITFDITNNTNDAIDFSIEPYYVEFYSNNLSLIKKYILTESLQSKQTKNVEVNITDDVKFYRFYQIENENYPDFDLKEDASGNLVMTCPGDTSTYLYTFIDNKLTKINDFGKYIITDSDYEMQYNYFSNLKNNNTNNAVTIELNESVDEFNYNLEIDYSKGDATFSNKHYYAKDTSPNKIAYLMESYSIICR